MKKVLVVDDDAGVLYTVVLGFRRATTNVVFLPARFSPMLMRTYWRRIPTIHSLCLMRLAFSRPSLVLSNIIRIPADKGEEACLARLT